MRQHLTTTLCGLLVVAATAMAAPPAKPGSAEQQPIDITPVADKLDVYRDDAGMYYVSPRPGAVFPKDQAFEHWVFYGDGKTLYQQRVVGFSHDGGKSGYDWVVWAPRVRGMQNAFVALVGDKPYAQCEYPDGKKPLTQLTADEVKALLPRATVLPPRWQRSAHFLGRGDDGVYYYVDELREEFGGDGHRLFVGPKGAMQEQVMTDVVSDRAGEIYATRSGDLKIVSAGGKASWNQGTARTELVVLELPRNRYLIYRELGIYGQLGIVCDDQ